MESTRNRTSPNEPVHETAPSQLESPVSTNTDSEPKPELPIFAAGRRGSHTGVAGTHPQRRGFATELNCVLAVDDQASMIKALATMFKAIGVPVLGAANGGGTSNRVRFDSRARDR